MARLPPAGPAPAASASQRRRERERRAMRARLLQAAREIAAEDGWQAVTIRKIADRLEYASPILYQHFESKDALIAALMADGFAEVNQALDAAARGAGASPGQILTQTAAAYWDFAFAAPELYQAMNGLGGVPFGTADTPAEAQQAFATVRAALHHAAVLQGRVLADPDGAVDTIWAFCHGFVSLTMAARIAGGPHRGRQLMLRALPPLFESLLT